MRATATIGGLCLVLLLLASLSLSRVGAQGAASGPVSRGTSGGEYQVDSWSISPGGSAHGEPFALVCAAGQPYAGLLIGGAYRLGGGFWGGGAVTASQHVYLPLVLRKY